MSDPLSVAGIAVRATSLGIQVCHGVISYSRSMRGRKQEIAGGLKEVQRLLSIFYSINDILPKIDQGTLNDSHAIRNCLRDSEEKLQELQQLLIKLRGPLDSHSIGGKFANTGRSIAYPFQEAKLISLHQTLQRLLDDLNLAIGITKSGAENDRKIDAVRSTLVSIQDESRDHREGLESLQLQVRENSDQIKSLQILATSTLNDIEQRLSETEWSVKDLDQSVSGKLTLIQSGIASSNIVTVETLTRLLHEVDYKFNDKLNEQSADIARMNLQLSQIIKNYPEDETHDYSKSKPTRLHEKSNLRIPRKAATLMVTTTTSRVKSMACNCPSKRRSVTYSYTFWGVTFQFEQEIPAKHRRDCRFYSIDRETKRIAFIEFPFKMWWFLARIIRACVIYTTGNSSPGISIYFRNIVPYEHSAVFKELQQIGKWVKYQPRSSLEINSRLESYGRTVLSLYRDGKASPNDLDECGRNHAMMLVGLMTKTQIIEAVASDTSVLATALQLLQTFVEIVHTDNEKVFLAGLIAHHFKASRKSQSTWLGGQKMMSYIAGTFEVDSDGVWRRQTPSGYVTSTLGYLPDIMSAMELSPMARAILSRSLPDLDRCITRNPKAVLERLSDHTTLQLCSIWPEGLRRLLEVQEARDIIDVGDGFDWPDCPSPPVIVAVRFNAVESVDLLMKAGCTIPFPLKSEKWAVNTIIEGASRECLDVVASNVAKRRWSLLKLAQRELGISPLDVRPSHAPDAIAASLCEMLDDAGVGISHFMRVPPSYKTIYHYPEMPLRHFPIFFANGFLDHMSHNDLGLTPVMVWRRTFEFRGPDGDPEKFLPLVQWLQEHGFLDQTSEDGWGLGLNVHATGWHYIAAMFGSHYSEPNQHQLFGNSLAGKMTRLLSQIPARDKCTCWCSPEGKGCSPLKLLWKAYAQRPGMKANGDHGWNPEPLRSILFYYEEEELYDTTLEFVRFLTFEALDMTHTCCSLGQVNLEGRCLYTCSDYEQDESLAYVAPGVLVRCDMEQVRQVRQDALEQRNACLLDTLMGDFGTRMKDLKSSSETLESFFWAYWKRRISEIFSVDVEVMDGLERVVERVQTHVLPERVLKFLGYDFSLSRTHV
ncbi:hypothetical protein F5Y04DRAFT_286605 [Hypomontagnella monticulosa]|nr:hypothetical protein F5Y04DRAFT_286605 [Hypomontagnella monticulosa]